MAFGIIYNNNKRFVICEIRLKIKSIKKVKDNFHELAEKFKNTKDLLGHEP